MEVHQIDLQTQELNLMMFQRIELSYHVYYNYVF